jgi:hypothetical protein
MMDDEREKPFYKHQQHRREDESLKAMGIIY